MRRLGDGVIGKAHSEAAEDAAVIVDEALENPAGKSERALLLSSTSLRYLSLISEGSNLHSFQPKCRINDSVVHVLNLRSS